MLHTVNDYLMRYPTSDWSVVLDALGETRMAVESVDLLPKN